MNKEQKSNDKVFTIVELLAVIALLGIFAFVGINAVSKYIEKEKQENSKETKKAILLATKKYLQDNSDIAPKVIGDYKIISAKELIQKKYLKKTIGNSCLEESFVRIYKYEGLDYSYNAYLYCNKNRVPDKIEVISPIISKFNFSDVNDILDTSFTMTIEGSEDKNSPLIIDNYSFIISAMAEGDTTYREVYNSNLISGNHKTKINKTYKLFDYINFNENASIKINIIVINEQGGITSATKQINVKSKRDLSDTISPKCSKIENEANPNEWINKDTIDNISSGYRKITVTCNDGEGSGCLDTTVSKSFPNNDIYRDEKHYYWGAEYAYIEVKDKAGNSSIMNTESKSSCRVRVNVDILSPKVDVTAIANNSIIKIASAGGADENYKEYPTKTTIKANSYILNKNTSDWIWFNKEYKDGIIYKIKVADNLHIYKYKWETNALGITKADYLKNKNLIKELKVENPDGKAEYFQEQDLITNDTGIKNAEFTIKLKEEGIRYGKLTVYDKAENKTIINIYANIDRTGSINQSSNVKEAVITASEEKENIQNTVSKLKPFKYVCSSNFITYKDKSAYDIY